ncbi:MAG: DUF4142 domain-containing protein [Gemmatimonadaceae bacterium]|nr:DUF4142 domain-containing protein [Gemmatimonadaceae bacterium]
MVCALLLAGAMNASAQGNMRAPTSVDRPAIDRLIAPWASRPRLGAEEMMAKYGMPQEATPDRLIWHNAGGFKRIAVMNLETPHDFPMPHVDFLEHTVTYNVPQGKVGALIEFDASSTINRTVGELSARCDLEGHNILTLNLDHDIVMGRKTVAQARKAFGDNVRADVMGRHPAYVEGLLFKPQMPATAAFSDKPVVPGSPERGNDMDASAKAKVAANGAKGGDAEIVATVFAVDLNEVLASSEAQKKQVSPAVMSYAKMLHEDHGANMDVGLKLGQQIGLTPVITPAVEAVQVKGAAELAAIVPLDGTAFERAYLAMMIKGHQGVLAMIDGQLMPAARNAALKQHLTHSREHVAKHLADAQRLQGMQGR